MFKGNNKDTTCPFVQPISNCLHQKCRVLDKRIEKKAESGRKMIKKGISISDVGYLKQTYSRGHLIAILTLFRMGILGAAHRWATPGLIKITIFWNKSYDITISVDDITNQNFITWLKLLCRCAHVTKVW